MAILQSLHSTTGWGRHVFAGRDPKKRMSDATVNAALRRMGYDTKTEMTGTASAMARRSCTEELGIDRDAIEHQFAHAVPDVLRTALQPDEVHHDRRMARALKVL